MNISNGHNIPGQMTSKYLSRLIDRFFKILPLKEMGEPSLVEYMRSLQAELIGYKDLMEYLENDASYLTLLSTLQYLIDNDCETAVVKREVFKAISVCKTLISKYCRNER